MNLVGDVQRRHKKGRSKAEKCFKKANMFILAIQAACFLIPLAYSYIAAGDTFEGDFTFPAEFTLTGGFESKTQNCSFTSTMSVKGYKDVPITLNKYNHYRILTETAADIRFVFFIYGVALALGATTKLLFDVNFFYIRVRHLVIHKEILTTIELFFLFAVYYFAGTVEPWAAHCKAYFADCGIESDSLFDLPGWPALYIGNTVCLGAHFFSFASYLHTTLAVSAEELSGVPANDTPAGMQRAFNEKSQERQQEIHLAAARAAEVDMFEQQRAQYSPQRYEPSSTNDPTFTNPAQYGGDNQQQQQHDTTRPPQYEDQFPDHSGSPQAERPRDPNWE